MKERTFWVDICGRKRRAQGKNKKDRAQVCCYSVCSLLLLCCVGLLGMMHHIVILNAESLLLFDQKV